MRSLPRGSRRGLPAAIAAATLGAALLAAPASAHVDHPDAIDLFNGVSGAYALRVVATPYVGSLEVTAVVAPAGASGADDLGAVRVTLSARAADGSESVGPAQAAANDLSRPDDYWALLTPRQAGAWVVAVEVDSALGATRLELPLTLRERGGGFPWAAAVAITVVAAPLALSAVLARRRRSARALRKGIR
ncbi:MAG: hypothetical protein OXI25_07560 [Chloroflexota bacterium]|nr:hypothetical protein [Chloroflexota bacterium]